MYILTEVLQSLFPLIALIFFLIGMRKKIVSFIIAALWLSLILLFIHFKLAGGQIFGTYFNYSHAAIYSINLMVLILSLTQIISHLSIDNASFSSLSRLVNASILIGSLLLIINLWVNAFFVENRLKDTPILQVVSSEKVSYCSNRTIFYRVSMDGAIAYLCPNYYGLIPTIGILAKNPTLLTSGLPLPAKKTLLLLQKKSNLKFNEIDT